MKPHVGLFCDFLGISWWTPKLMFFINQNYNKICELMIWKSALYHRRWWNHMHEICLSKCYTDTSQCFLEQLPLFPFLLDPKLFELHLFPSQISPKLFFISRLRPAGATVATGTPASGSRNQPVIHFWIDMLLACLNGIKGSELAKVFSLSKAYFFLTISLSQVGGIQIFLNGEQWSTVSLLRNRKILSW